MNLQKFEELTAKEQAEFSIICNLLLSCTYILRENAEQRISKEYTFIERNFQLFEDYLSLSGWSIKRDDQYGVIYVRNTDGHNKLILSKLATVCLFSDLSVEVNFPPVILIVISLASPSCGSFSEKATTPQNSPPTILTLIGRKRES